MSEVKKEKKATKRTTKKDEKDEIKETKTVKKTTRVKKETKKEEVIDKALLNQSEQHNYTLLCKIVMILAKIGKIALMIFVPFIFLTMIIIPFVFKKFEISANIIKFDDISIIVNDDRASIKIGDSVHVLKCDANVLNNITTYLTENSKSTIITFIELSLLLFAVILILYIYLLVYIEKLFKNFMNKKTPFIKENANYIYKIALFMCALKFISICLSFANVPAIRSSSFSIFIILIMFVVYFVFMYAVKLQDKTNDKICD